MREGLEKGRLVMDIIIQKGRKNGFSERSRVSVSIGLDLTGVQGVYFGCSERLG